MKYMLSSIALITAVCLSIAFTKRTVTEKYFEGKISYALTITAAADGIDTSELRRILGTGSDFYFKEGNYHQYAYYAKGKPSREETYLAIASKVYTKKNSTDTIYVGDVSAAQEPLLHSEMAPGTEKVGGIDCKKFTLYYKSINVTYYYNPDSLRVDPEWFRNYHFFDKNLSMKEMGSLYYRCDLNLPKFTITLTAAAVAHQKVDDNMFVLPKNAIYKDEE